VAARQEDRTLGPETFHRYKSNLHIICCLASAMIGILVRETNNERNGSRHEIGGAVC